MRIFKEEQRFNQPWIIVLLIITTVPYIIIIYKAFLKNKMSLFHCIIAIGFILLVIGFIFVIKLKTRIDEIGIHYQFYPMHLKMRTIPWKDIKYAQTRTYNALLEYGGWGLKNGGFFAKKGKAINIKGNIGIQLILIDNKKLLIGTQKKLDADNVIGRYFHKH